MRIKGKEVEIKVTGRTLLLYKQVFKKDFFKTISKMGEEMEYTDLFELIYILYKQASGEGVSYADFSEVFMEELDLGEVMSEEIMTEFSQAISRSMETTKEVKKKVTEENPTV